MLTSTVRGTWSGLLCPVYQAFCETMLSAFALSSVSFRDLDRFSWAQTCNRFESQLPQAAFMTLHRVTKSFLHSFSHSLLTKMSPVLRSSLHPVSVSLSLSLASAGHQTCPGMLTTERQTYFAYKLGFLPHCKLDASKISLKLAAGLHFAPWSDVPLFSFCVDTAPVSKINSSRMTSSPE